MEATLISYRHFLHDALLGGSVAAVYKLTYLPIERFPLWAGSVRMLQPPPNTIDGIMRGIKKIGGDIIWRGATKTVTQFAAIQGTTFGITDFLRRKYITYDERTYVIKSFTTNLICGGVGGLASSPILLGMLNDSKIAQSGIESLSLTIFSAFIYRSLQLGIFNQMQCFNPHRYDQNMMGLTSTLTSAVFAQIIASATTHPIWQVRQKFYYLTYSSTETPSIPMVIKDILKNDGISGLAKGSFRYGFRHLSTSIVITSYDRLKLYYDFT